MIETIIRKVENSIGGKVSITPYDDDRIPMILSEIYTFYTGTIAGKGCLFVQTHETPVVRLVQKHFIQVKNITGMHVILVCLHLSAEKRRLCIQQRIPFLTDDMQVYLPFVYLEMTGATSKTIRKKRTKFSPLAQVVFLMLLSDRGKEVQATTLAETLDCTVMSASRALQELYILNLITYRIAGRTLRSKLYRRVGDPEYLTTGKDFLIDPVWKRVYTSDTRIRTPLAGLHALSEASLLASPALPVCAIGRKQYALLEIETIPQESAMEYLDSYENLHEVEIWKYDPCLLTTSDHVDIISLDSSLKNYREERIIQALEQQKEAYSWYTA